MNIGRFRMNNSLLSRSFSEEDFEFTYIQPCLRCFSIGGMYFFASSQSAASSEWRCRHVLCCTYRLCSSRARARQEECNFSRERGRAPSLQERNGPRTGSIMYCTISNTQVEWQHVLPEWGLCSTSRSMNGKEDRENECEIREEQVMNGQNITLHSQHVGTSQHENDSQWAESDVRWERMVSISIRAEQI